MVPQLRKPDQTYEDLGLILEGQRGIKTVSAFRAMLLKLAYRINKTDKRGVLLLVDPVLSSERIDREWAFARESLRTGTFHRLSVVRSHEGTLSGWPIDPDPKVAQVIEQFLQEEGPSQYHNLTRRDAPSTILRILVDRWLLGNRPITATALGDLSGFSFPTISSTLGKLEDVVVRESDRSIRLSRFPQAHFRKLIVNSESIRSTLRYRDSASSQIPVKDMLLDIDWFEAPKLAAGGVTAAKYVFPQIDLVGESRLDLCVHSPDNHVDISFVQGINPALKITTDRTGPCDLALHFVRSADPLFHLSAWEGRLGPPMAGPSEILLDLHELGFAGQAEETKRFLEERRGYD